MAKVCNNCAIAWVLVTLVVAFPWTALGLTSNFYSKSCKNLQSVVQSAFNTQLQQDGRVGASLTRLHFHDCFVQGCDASVLLDDTANFTGEKTAAPNANSLRGFSAVDAIKSAVEAACPGVVSCADILALVARDAVVADGGPSWTVQFGRLDGVTASLSLANTNLPSPNSNVQSLTTSFANQGLTQVDMVALSGAHTFGNTKCGTINSRLYNWQNSGTSDPTIQPSYLTTLEGECPNQASSANTVIFNDPSTGTVFDNDYYSNLLSNRGTFHSDQALQSEGGPTASTVLKFAKNQNTFFSQFTKSIVKMGGISPPSGSRGEVRKSCRQIN